MHTLSEIFLATEDYQNTQQHCEQALNSAAAAGSDNKDAKVNAKVDGDKKIDSASELNGCCCVNS